MMYLFGMSLQKEQFVTENFEISPKKSKQSGQKYFFQMMS